MLSFSTCYILKIIGISTGVGLSWSAQNESNEVNKVKHREQSKEIVSLTCLLGTGNTNQFIQQHKLVKHTYK